MLSFRASFNSFRVLLKFNVFLQEQHWMQKIYHTPFTQKSFGLFIACAACFVFLFATSLQCVSQETNTYTLDSDFDTGVLFRHINGVKDLIEDDEGLYMAVGDFDPANGPFRYSGRVFSDGTADFSWNSPLFSSGYNQIAPFDEDRFLIINVGGEYLNDFTANGEVIYTTQANTPPVDFYLRFIYGPYLIPFDPVVVTSFEVMPDNGVLMCGLSVIGSQGYRLSLVRLNPDGIVDPNFPLIECDPNSGNAHATDIISAPGGKWYLSGSFAGVNGHASPNLVRLNPDFTVDTSFTSPLAVPEIMGIQNVSAEYVDSEGRIWLSSEGVQLQESAGEPVWLTRIMPDGSLDDTFSSPSLSLEQALTSEETPEMAGISGIAPLNGNYLVYGKFATYNDTSRNCIAMIDEGGHLVSNYFEELGADSCRYYDQVRHPFIADVLIEGDGALVVGGAFSSFGGEAHYNMVKLQPGTVGLEEKQEELFLNVFPNPAGDKAWVRWSQNNNPSAIYIYSTTGQLVEMVPINGGEQQKRLDLSGISPGVYFVELVQKGEKLNNAKFIIQH